MDDDKIMYIHDKLVEKLLNWNQQEKKMRKWNMEKEQQFHFKVIQKHLKKANEIQEENWKQEYEFVDVDAEKEISWLLNESNHIFTEYFKEEKNVNKLC